jgi:hypothetical protein
MKPLFILLFICFTGLVSAQEEDGVLPNTSSRDSLPLEDTKYREDQFYIGITYNVLGDKTSNVTQSGFSSGFHLGFIRDFPLNSRRNVAIGLGVGLSGNSYNQNLLISEFGSDYNYNVLNDVSFSRNRFSTYLFEIPLEFRWRTSTATEYDFWRVYTGFKFGYVFYNTSKYRGEPSNSSLTNISDINALQYGLTLSVGYSNVNFHFYYGLNTIFDKGTVVTMTGERIDMKSIKIGLMFYIL